MCDKRNNFCYICGYFVDSNHRYKFQNHQVAVEEYNKLFNSSYKSSSGYEPEYICLLCLTKLKLGKTKKNGNHILPFSSPMIWHNQTYHKRDDCYFCKTNTAGFKYKNRQMIQYAEVLSVSKPVPLKQLQDEQFQTEKEAKFEDIEPNDPDYLKEASCSRKRHFVSNADYKDLIRDFGLSRRQSEGLGSRLRQWNLVQADFRVTSIRNDDRSLFQEVFKSDTDIRNLVHCTNIEQLFCFLNHNYVPEEWRLFIDGSCKSKHFT